MAYENIIGREIEIKRLERCYNEQHSQLVIISGRRRVGKTFLVNELFEEKYVFKFTGARDTSMNIQLENFSNEYFRRTSKKIRPKKWIEAFEYLREYLDSFDDDKKLVVFFDEMPWMDTKKSLFLSSFEYFWNDYGSAKKNLLFIVCGSASSWFQKKILNNKGGLFDRHSAFISLYPFSLKETELFLISKNIYWSRKDIVSLYMIVGGIPYYLNNLDRDMSLNENIDNLFFSKNAILKDEFKILYSTLFENEEYCTKIVEILSNVRNGMTRKDIADAAKISYNGNLSKNLESLEISGFIESFTRYGDRQEVCYRLCDYFSLFYLRFVKNKKINDYNYWTNSYMDPSRRVYESLGFELLCLKEVDKIKNAISIAGVLSNNYSWLKKGSEYSDGAQIDLVIDRKDKVVSICEIKFYDSEYEIDKEYSTKLRRKIDVFINTTKIRKTIQLVIISPYGLKKNMYSGMINKVVTIDDLF